MAKSKIDRSVLAEILATFRREGEVKVTFTSSPSSYSIGREFVRNFLRMKCEEDVSELALGSSVWFSKMDASKPARNRQPIYGRQ